MYYNHIVRSRNPRAIYLPKEEDDEYLSNEAPFKEMHQSFYIVSAPPGEEDDEYLSDEILSKTDYDDIPCEDEDYTHFQVNMDNAEAWLYSEDLPSYTYFGIQSTSDPRGELAQLRMIFVTTKSSPRSITGDNKST